MTQTRLSSLYEALFNVVIGYSINFFANLVILPAFGFDISWSANLLMGVPYTVVSIARSYCIRRWFNARLQRLAQRMAGASL